MPKVIESMTRVPLSGGRVVRVWREEQGLTKEYDTGDIQGCVIMNSALPQNKLVEAVLKLPRINAVEVIDMRGNGVVYYSDWP